MNTHNCPPHQWVLETPSGPRVYASCKKCKAESSYLSGWYDYGDSPDFTHSRLKGMDRTALALEKRAKQSCPHGHIGLREAAKIYGIPRSSMATATARGALPTVKVGNLRWVKPADVENWNKKRRIRNGNSRRNTR